MNPKQYREALEAIGLNVNNAAKVIGKSTRASRSYANPARKTPVDPAVARLLYLIMNLQFAYNDALERLMTRKCI